MYCYHHVYLCSFGDVMVMIGDIKYSKLVDHYIQMKRVQEAGGLRKELNAEICVYMMIMFHHPKYNPIEAMMVAKRVKETVLEIERIPFPMIEFTVPKQNIK